MSRFSAHTKRAWPSFLLSVRLLWLTLTPNDGTEAGHWMCETSGWIQEKEKILSVAAIPSADIGAKNLAKKRLLGLLFTPKMVNSGGRDRKRGGAECSGQALSC